MGKTFDWMTLLPDEAAYRHDLAVRRLATRERVGLAIIEVFGRSVPYLVVLGVVYFGIYRGLQVIAGVVTADVLKAAIQSNLWGYLIGGAGLTYGVSVRIRFVWHQRRVSREHQHTKELEKLIWPGRTSSEMPYTGETKPGD